MVHPKTVTLWQTYKKSTTTLVCATASAEHETERPTRCWRIPGPEAASPGSTALLAAEVRWVLGRNATGAKSYPSARITRVSGWTPSCFIASAAGSVCMNS